jgi:calcineurin-like phosphoesterase
VIGVKREQVLERFMTMMPVKFETSDEDPWVMGVLIEAGDDGRATSIEQLLIEANPA